MTKILKGLCIIKVILFLHLCGIHFTVSHGRILDLMSCCGWFHKCRSSLRTCSLDELLVNLNNVPISRSLALGFLLFYYTLPKPCSTTTNQTNRSIYSQGIGNKILRKTEQLQIYEVSKYLTLPYLGNYHMNHWFFLSFCNQECCGKKLKHGW